MKTNKSYTKRLKVTKTGKILARGAGQNHFNAKESRSNQLNHKRMRTVWFGKKATARFIRFSK